MRINRFEFYLCDRSDILCRVLHFEDLFGFLIFKIGTIDVDFCLRGFKKCQSLQMQKTVLLPKK